MIELFVLIDDLIWTLNVLWSDESKLWRKPMMWKSEIITCMIFWLFVWFKTVKSLYREIISYYQDCFRVPSYKNFLANINKCWKDAMILLCAILHANRTISQWRKMFIDASCVAVCHNKRIFGHKVCKWIAQRWKSTMGRFYGFKVHMIVDDQWNPLSFSITPWNTDDRKVVKRMVRKLTWVLIADAWYVGTELRNDLAKMWVLFLTWYKKNMKMLVTQRYNKVIKLRQIVETWFWMMKCWGNLVSSYARSVWWHLSRIVYNFLWYALKKLAWNQSLAIS